MSVELVLACIGPGERCTRAQIMQRLDMGMATVQYMLNAGIASGALRRSPEGRCHVWWKPSAAARPLIQPRAVLRGYESGIQQFREVCMAARPPAPPGQVIRYGVGWQ